MPKQSSEAQSTNAQPQPAGQMRVKKDEFACAIAALESRRQAELKAKEGTVIIGDVLQQLQIDLPADEVLHEIERLHSGQTQERSVRRPLWNAEQIATVKLIVGIFLVPVAAVGLAVLLLNQLRTQKSAIPSGSFSSGSANQPLLWTMPPPYLPPGGTAEIADEGGFNASSVLKPLSAVPDNQPVHCTTASLQRLFSMGYTTPVLTNPLTLAQSNQLFDVRPNLHKPWTLIKHQGQLYVRGWVTAKFTEAQAQGQSITLHSTPSSFDPGVQPVPITLLAKFRPYFSNLDDERRPEILQVEGFISAPSTWKTLQQGSLPPSKIILDTHAWEKW